MPLSGFGSWNDAGSQPSASSNSANRGRISSHAAAGSGCREMTFSVSATNERTSGESTRNSSSLIGEGEQLRDGVPVAHGRGHAELTLREEDGDLRPLHLGGEPGVGLAAVDDEMLGCDVRLRELAHDGGL